jgi:hypothetical protein
MYADLFQKMHFSDHVITVDQDSPHIIGTDGKEMWGDWRMEFNYSSPKL